ncbi:MAG: flippase-like domain-containing protein [Thermoflexales bacterium]|nr:flippase-like domain-containing protein [Thermoflexales bacterium]
MNRRWLFWVGVAVSAVFLYFALQGLHLDKLVEDLRRTNLAWLLPGIGAYFVSVGLRAMRWSCLLKSVTALTPQQLYSVVVIGYMGNNVYPARIGELLRAYILRRNYQTPIPSTLATILIERAMDSAVMLGFVVAGLPAVAGLDAAVERGLALLGAALVVALAGMIWLAARAEAAGDLADRILDCLLPQRLSLPLQGVVHRFAQGAQSLRRPNDLAFVVATTVAVWLFETVKYWCVAQAFSLTLPINGLMLVNGLSNLFTILPGAPGAIGTFDAGGVLGMTALGVERSLAVAYVLVLHAVLWFPVTTLGLVLMVREGLRWTDLRQAETSAA